MDWLLVWLYRLEVIGYGIGLRVVELVSCRDRVTKRETRVVNMLQVNLLSHKQCLFSKIQISCSVCHECPMEIFIWQAS
jgi:hypothetical protein